MPKLSHSTFKRQRASLRTIVAAAVVAATALTIAPAAKAGDYRVFSCRTPTGALVSGADWRVETAGDAPLSTNACATDGLMYATLGVPQRSTMAWTGFGLHLPDPLRVTHLSADRWAMVMPGVGGDNGASVQYDLLAGDDSSPWRWSDANISETCRLASGCVGFAWDGVGPGSAYVQRNFSPGVSFVGFAVSCRGSDWGACGWGDNGRAHLRVNAVDLTIEDSSAPEITVPSGSVLEQGPRSGLQSLEFSASDRGAGVYHAVVRLDGEEIARTTPDSRASCADLGVLPNSDLEFDRVQPCADHVGASFSFDTTKFTEGTHELEAFVRDAAGNLSGRFTKSIQIDNVPPPVVRVKPTITGSGVDHGLRLGDKLVATNGVWAGPTPTFKLRWQRNSPSGEWIDIANGVSGMYTLSADDIDHQVRVVVTAISAEGKTEIASDPTTTIVSGATVGVAGVPMTGSNGAGANGAGGNLATGQLVVDREQRTVDIRHGAKIVVTGRLIDAAGNPIADASVDVFEQIAVTAAPWNKVDSIKTDSQGGYAYRPKTTASRRLRFAYSDRRDGSDYRATREVFISVTAGMTIRARSRAVPRRGLIRLNGKVIVDQLPERGAWVEVQVLDAKVWRTVATRRIGPDGRWAFKHRLRDASATRFTFRSRLRVAGDLATAEAKSVPLKVRVR